MRSRSSARGRAFVTKTTVGLNRHRALQNCADRPGERFHNSTNGLIKWNHRHQNSQMARERCACNVPLVRLPPSSPAPSSDHPRSAPPPYPIPIHPRNLLFVLTVNVVSALWNSLISQILPNNFRVTRHWIAFPRPVITKIPDASVSSSPSGVSVGGISNAARKTCRESRICVQNDAPRDSSCLFCSIDL